MAFFLEGKQVTKDVYVEYETEEVLKASIKRAGGRDLWTREAAMTLNQLSDVALVNAIGEILSCRRMARETLIEAQRAAIAHGDKAQERLAAVRSIEIPDPKELEVDT